MIRAHTYSKGFTLVEVLVAIAIIGILSAVVFASFEESRQKARDAARVSDIQQLSAALEVFGATYGRYPSSADGTCSHHNSFAAGGCMQALVDAGLYSILPKDPQDEPYSGTWSNSQMYFYDNWCRDPSGTSDKHYRLWANGERDHGSTAQNWWYDTTIGSTPCNDPS